MSDDFSLKFKGMEELQGKLQEIRKQFPYEEETILKRVGLKLKRMSIKRTPTGKEFYYYKGKKIKRSNKSHLNKSYKLSKVNYERDEMNITMTNTSPHFHLVERGHRQVTKGGEEIGYTQGKYMVERSMKELEEELPADLEKWIKKILK